MHLIDLFSCHYHYLMAPMYNHDLVSMGSLDMTTYDLYQKPGMYKITFKPYQACGYISLQAYEPF